MRRPLVLTSLLLGAACGDVQVRSVRIGPVVPAELQGEWIGTWQSATATASGPLQVRLQEFRGEPVVSVQIDNPCIEPREYQLVLRPNAIELRAEGEAVLAASVGAERTMVGTFQCETDQGTWTAAWVRALPTLGDLSGEWIGTITPAAVPPMAPVPRPVRLELQQTVRGGTVALDGVLDAPELLLMPLLVEGYTIFRDTSFDLLLQSNDPAGPTVILSALGDREPLRVDFGLAQAFGNGPLPFGQAVFTLEWQAP
jgi:hypothetical protein